MENYIYRRDYSDKYKIDNLEEIMQRDIICSSPEFKKALIISEVMHNIPRPVNPAGKEVFDRLVPEFDKYAEDMGCRMEAEIDYVHNIATIELITADCFDFECSQHFDLIMAIAQDYANFSFELTDKHEIRWKTYINYFEDLVR